MKTAYRTMALFQAVLLLVGPLPQALAGPAATTTPDVGTAASLEGASLRPVLMETANTQAFSSIMTSCAAPLGGDALAKVAATLSADPGSPGIMAGAISIDTPCPDEAGSLPEGSAGTSCDLVSIGGKYSEAQFQALNSQVTQTQAAIQCKFSKLQAIQGELGCASGTGQALVTQASALGPAYAQNSAKFQQDVGNLKSIESDRKTQKEDVLKRLNGDKDSGTEGLLQADARLEGASAAVAAEAQAVKEQVKALDLQQKSYEEAVESTTAANAGSCFINRKEPGYICYEEGRKKQVTAKEYMLCRFEQNARTASAAPLVGGAAARTTGRVFQTGKRIQEQAEVKRAQLETLVDQIIEEFPKKGELPKSQQEAEAALSDSSGILTMADLEAKYGDRLAQFDGNGLPIRNFLLNTMNKCFVRAKNDTNRLARQTNSPIKRAKESVKAANRALANTVKQSLYKNNLEYRKAMKALTGYNLGLETKACDNAVPEVQGSCMDDLEGKVKGLLDGSAKEGTMKVSIAATDQKRQINFVCEGVKGCSSAYQNISRNLDSEIVKVSTFKRDYITKANSNMESFDAQIAGPLSAQSQAIAEKMKKIQAVGSTLGVKMDLNLKPVKTEPIEYDEDGLIKPPKNALARIAAKVNPPLPDMSAGNFSQPLNDVAEATTALQSRAAKAKDALVQMNALKTSCSVKAVQDLAALLDRDVQGLSQSNCALYVEEQKDNDLFKDLLASVAGLNSGAGLDVGTVDSLKTGIQSIINQGQSQARRPASATGAPQIRIGEQSYNPSSCASLFVSIQGKLQRIGAAQKAADASASEAL